jgi:uncharacterized protein (DUF2141 family)
MKKLSFKIFIFIILIVVTSSYKISNETILSIEVTAIPFAKKGNLRIGIFKKEGYPNPEKAVNGKVISVTSNKMIVNFPNFPAGIYGVAVIHDHDKNGKLSRNAFGYPTEAYGFSNNKFGTFGPPEFDEISFKVNEGKQTTISIKLKN